MLLSFAARADESEPSLIVGTWGGAYEAAQQAALFSPFEQFSGVRIRTAEYTGGLSILDEATPPDILDMLENEAELACQAGHLKSISHAEILSAGSIATSPNRGPGPLMQDEFSLADFHSDVFEPCSVAHLTYSTLIAYDESAFTGEKPMKIEDLFDLQRFPGKRGLQRSPAALFEWAMMAEGVPLGQVYDLLSTERGLRLVTQRLDILRDQIIWWDDPAEAVTLREQGKVVMASGYNGRFFDAWNRGAAINMIWDGQIIDRSVWAVPKASSADMALVNSFLRFALHPERLAHMARLIPYGPLRFSAFGYIGLHPDTGMVMSDHLPTAAHHLTSALHRDTRWYARTFQLRNRVFSDWLGRDTIESE
ncbi:extracellular solute-binding protein [Granulosicoccus sp. 3-233]|uniref:extracellular solute-binding protein n=1 Tax=Granulosicoccus sp. 3-233 TaxID=3417969 RepID=UPI003D337A21